MSVLLITPHDFDSVRLRQYLGDYGGIAVRQLFLDGDLAENESVSDVAICTVVTVQQNLAELGERVQQARLLVGDEALLIVCGPRVADREVVKSCGASLVITPRSSTPRDVAERLLAELIAFAESDSFGALRGESPPMRALYREIEVVAELNETVLILGETGTGKELVAQELHRRSGRPGDLLAINCAALSPELVESELFGHVKGAFSGAVSHRRGLLSEAGRGTVFLDEVGELAPSSQAKLLRTLEERMVRPVGGNHWQSVEARILLATNRDLEEAIGEGNYRQDLFQRISGFTLHLPPLRERKADIVLLARHFLDEYELEYGGGRKLPHEALDPLFRHDWPGNVRQLRQVIRQAAAYAVSEDGEIDTCRLHEAVQKRSRPFIASQSVAFDPSLESWRDVHERIREVYFKALLEEVGGNRTEAIRRSGVSRSRFYEILEKMK